MEKVMAIYSRMMDELTNPVQAPATKFRDYLIVNGNKYPIYRCTCCGAQVAANATVCSCGRLLERVNINNRVMQTSEQEQFKMILDVDDNSLLFAFGTSAFFHQNESELKQADATSVYKQKGCVLIAGEISLPDNMTVYADIGLKKNKKQLLPVLTEPESADQLKFSFRWLNGFLSAKEKTNFFMKKVTEKDKFYSVIFNLLSEIAKQNQYENDKRGIKNSQIIQGKEYIDILSLYLRKIKEHRENKTAEWAQRVFTSHIEDARLNYPEPSSDILQLVQQTKCILVKSNEMKDTVEEYKFVVACSCGYSKTIAKNFLNVPNSEFHGAREKILCEVQKEAKRCAACGNENTHSTVTLKNGKKIDVKFESAVTGSKADRYFVTIEKSGLPDCSVLLRYFHAAFSIDETRNVQQVVEEGRCFINEEGVNFYADKAVLNRDPEADAWADFFKKNGFTPCSCCGDDAADNRAKTWEKVSSTTFEKVVGKKNNFIFLQEDEMKRIMSGYAENSMVRRILECWDCRNDGSKKNPFNIPGNVHAIVMHTYGPAFSVLYKAGFKRIVSFAFDMPSKVIAEKFSPKGTTPAEALGVTREYLSAITNIIPAHSLSLSVVNDCKLFKEKASADKVSDKTLAYLTVNHLLENADMARKYGIPTEDFAEYVRKVSKMYVLDAYRVSDDLQNYLKRTRVSVLPQPANHMILRAATDIAVKMGCKNSEFGEINTEDNRKLYSSVYSQAESNISPGETFWFADNKARTLIALLQDDEFVADAVRYLSGIDRSCSIDIDMEKGREKVFLQMIEAEGKLKRIVCLIYSEVTGEIKQRVFD